MLTIKIYGVKNCLESQVKVREAAKKLNLFSGLTTKSSGGKGLATKKKNFFEALKNIPPKNESI